MWQTVMKLLVETYCRTRCKRVKCKKKGEKQVIQSHTKNANPQFEKPASNLAQTLEIIQEKQVTPNGTT